MTSKEAAQKAAHALTRAETAVAALPSSQAADLLIRIAERWEQLSYQIGQIEEEENKLKWKSSS